MQDPPKKAGRKPALKDGVLIALRIDGADKKKLDELAKQGGVGVSEVIRQAIKAIKK